METTTLPSQIFASKKTWKIYSLNENGHVDFAHPLPLSIIRSYEFAGENFHFEMYELKEPKTLINNEGDLITVTIDTYLEVKQLLEEGIWMTLIKDMEGKTHSIIIPNQKF